MTRDCDFNGRSYTLPGDKLHSPDPFIDFLSEGLTHKTSVVMSYTESDAYLLGTVNLRL